MAKKTAPVKVNDEITSTEQSRGTAHYPTTTSHHVEPTGMAALQAHSSRHSRQGEPAIAGNAVTHQKQFLNINFNS